MPKIKDYLKPTKDYFTKNFGLNTVTTAVLPVLVQTVAVGSPMVAAEIATAVTPETFSVIQAGGAGGIVALLMLTARILLAIHRSK